MCLEFSSCFGTGRHEDVGRRDSRVGREDLGRRDSRVNRGNGYYAPPAYDGGRRRSQAGHGYSGVDHKATPAYQYHHQPAVDEAWRKAYAYHDGGRKDPAYAYPSSADETLKVPAWNRKVGDDTDYTYTARLHGAANYRENAVDYHHYPTTTTTLW